MSKLFSLQSNWVWCELVRERDGIPLILMHNPAVKILVQPFCVNVNAYPTLCVCL